MSGQPVFVEMWGKREHEQARLMLHEVLDGVGTGVTKVALLERSFSHGPRQALHAKRVLSEAEQATLTAEWCALPAFDGAGDDVLEELAW